MTYKYNTVNNTAKNNTNLDYTIDLSKYFTTTTSSKKSDYTISILDKIKSISRGLTRMITSTQF